MGRACGTGRDGAAPAAGTEPTVQGKEGSPRTEPQPHPAGCHIHSVGELPWEPDFPGRAQMRAAQQLAHSKLLFSPGLSNSWRRSSTSCLKCYEINSFWGTVVTPVPQKAGVGQREKGRGMEVLGGQRPPGTPAVEMLHSHGNMGKQLKEGSPMQKNVSWK